MTTTTGPLALIALLAAICALAGLLAFFVTLAHVGKTKVLLNRDRWQLIVSILLTVIGAAILFFLLLGPPAKAWSQEAPPPGWVRATVSTCAPYNPSACQSKTVWLDSQAWCGKRANWWSPHTGREVVTVRCGQ